MSEVNEKLTTQTTLLERHVRRFTIAVVGLLIVLPLCYYIWFGVLLDRPPSKSTGSWGEFGDFFGGVLNPLIAFSAFYWLTRSVLIQKTELEETRQALVASQEAHTEQAKTLAHQRFDSTFFSLLEQHNIVLDQLKKVPEPGPTEKPILSALRRRISQIDETYNEAMRGEFASDARTAVHANNGVCGHYFRLLYQILKYIATSCPGSGVGPHFRSEDIQNCLVTNDEKFYSNILRSFLDYKTTQLLAINCFTDDPEDPYHKYKLLVERYSFLEHMPFDDEVGLNQTLLMVATAYDRRAFDDSQFFTLEVEAEVEKLRVLSMFKS